MTLLVKLAHPGTTPGQLALAERSDMRSLFLSRSWPIVAQHRLGAAVKGSGPGQFATSGVRPLDGLGQAQQLGRPQ